MQTRGPPNVLVTGAAGYVGRLCVAALAERRQELGALVALDVNTVAERDRLQGVVYAQGDICDPALVELFGNHRIDTVIHLASIVRAPKGAPQDLAYRVDVLGTQNVLEACARSGVRKLIVTSSGAAYGYQAPSKQDATMTAIGLLCRMYGGWPRSQAALARGVRMLSKRGPSEHDLYYDYYATQVLRHYGGPEWTDWNLKMREFLINTQAKEGHPSGSWYFADKHGDQGGRVYNTAMALLILEVYYRHLPIYGQRVLGEGY